MSGRSINNTRNAEVAKNNIALNSAAHLNLNQSSENLSNRTANLPEIAELKKILDPELNEKIEQQVKLRYLSGSLSEIHRKLEMSREEKGIDPNLDQEITNIKDKKEKLKNILYSNWEVIKKELLSLGKTNSEINDIERSLQKVEIKSHGDYQEYQKQHEDAQQAAQLKELNKKSWYQRIADPLLRIILQSPELIKQQVGLLFGGYRELTLGMIESLSAGRTIVESWDNSVVRSGNYIENYRKQCEKEKRSNHIGSILGNTAEFARGNLISDLITLHPITAYANPVMEIVDAIYDEALLKTTNNFTTYMGGEETLSYIELKKLQSTNIYFKAGKISLDVAKIAGSLALSPQIAAQQGILSQVKIAENVVKNNFLFSGVISTGQELKSLSMPHSEETNKKFSLLQTLTNISSNTLANTANSIGMAGTVDALGKGYLGLNKLRLPQSKLNQLNTQIAQNKAMTKFQLGNTLYQTVDDLNDFLDSAKDTSQNLDWTNPLNALGHALVLGATTKDLMGNGPNDRSPFDNFSREQLITKADQAILDYGDTLTIEQFDNLLEQKHEVEARAFDINKNDARHIDLNGRDTIAYYSFNKEVLYFESQLHVIAYRNQRAMELSSGWGWTEIDSKGTMAFYDQEQDLIAATSPGNIKSKRDLIIHRSFLVHEIAHKKGLMSESLAYLAQAQYLLEYGYQMVFAEGGNKFEIVEISDDRAHSFLLPEIETIQYFVSQKENIYGSRQKTDSINSILASSFNENREENEKRFFRDLEAKDLETVVKERADYSLSLKDIALLLAREEKVIVWNFIKLYGLDNYNDYYDVALACAKFNIKQFFSNIKSFKFEKDHVYALAKECLIIDPQVTFKRLDLLTRLEEQDVFDLATECCNLFPIKFAENINLIIDRFNPSQRRTLALQCAENDPAATARKIKDFKITNQDDIVYVAQKCASLSGKATMLHIEKFNIKDPEDEFFVLLMCLRQDPVGAFHQLRKIDQFNQEQLIELATEAMLSNPSGSLALLDRFDIEVIDQFGTYSTQAKEVFWKPLLKKAIFSKDLPQALEILGIFENGNKLFETSEMLNKDKLPLFEKLEKFALAEYSLREDEVATLKCISEIISKWHIIPSGAMEALISLTSDELTSEMNLKIRNYISGLCVMYGSTFGDSICMELSKLFKANKDFHILQRIDIYGEAIYYYEAVNDFLSTGFRGFSVATYQAFWSAYQQDKYSALRLIREWQAWSRQIAKGEELPPKIKNNPLYPCLVIAAYRPVGMNIVRVESLLASVPDRTKHLSGLAMPSFKTIELFDKDSITHTEGRNLEITKIREIENILMNAIKYSSMEGIYTSTILFEAIKVGSLNKEKLIALIYKLNIGPIREKINELILLKEIGNDLESNSQIFYNLNQRLVLLNEILYLCSSTQFIKVLEDTLPLATIEFENSLRPYLEKKPGFRHLIGHPELFSRLFRSYILNVLETAFNKDTNVIKKERKKLKTVASTELQSIQGTITKTTESFFARASAGLCTAEDMYSWNNKNFLQINIVDINNHLVVGNVQMLRHLDEQSGQTYLIIRINPSSEFLKGTEPERLAAAMISLAVSVAELNNYIPCLPENDENLVLTNRKELIPTLQARYGKKITLNPKARIANKMFIETIYLLN